jgi:hypothetical protein
MLLNEMFMGSATMHLRGAAPSGRGAVVAPGKRIRARTAALVGHGADVGTAYVPAVSGDHIYSSPSAYTVNASSIEITSKAIGAAADDRIVVLALSWTAAAQGRNLASNCRIGGINATVATQIGSTNGGTEVYSGFIFAEVPNGTTATLNLQWSDVIANLSVDVFRLIGANPLDIFGGNNQSNADARITVGSPFNVPNRSYVMAAACIENKGSFATWDGLTEESDSTLGGDYHYTSAADHLLTGATNFSPGVTFSLAAYSKTLAVLGFGPYTGGGVP